LWSYVVTNVVLFQNGFCQCSGTGKPSVFSSGISAPARGGMEHPQVRVGAAVEKNFPGFGMHRGSIVEIDGGKVVVHWASDERTALTLKAAAKRVIAVPLTDEEEDDDDDVDDFGIESSPTSFSEIGGPLQAPRHVLLELDNQDDLRTVDDGSGDARKTSSRFWGVSWNKRDKKWKAQYNDADDKSHYIGYFVDEEEAARAYNKAILAAKLEGKRRMNAVDALGALVPKPKRAPKPKPKHAPKPKRDRADVVAPDPARAPTNTTSKFWGVTWSKQARRWRAQYQDANRQRCNIGYFDTQEAAAHAVNAAINRVGLVGRRKMNPVVDGQLVPRVGNARRKRRREEPVAAATPPRGRLRVAMDPDLEA